MHWDAAADALACGQRLKGTIELNSTPTGEGSHGLLLGRRRGHAAGCRTSSAMPLRLGHSRSPAQRSDRAIFSVDRFARSWTHAISMHTDVCPMQAVDQAEVLG
jgi:hypothetical protein